MIAAVFSDVHGNLPALETFLECTLEAVDQYICLGDTVNYGPWNDECLEIIQALPNSVMLEGNHERLFLGLDDISVEIELVQLFYRYSSASFSRDDLITDLPVATDLGKYLCTHTLGNERVYPETDLSLDRDTILGHSHCMFDRQIGDHQLINCGSIGQNRGQIDEINFLLFDSETNEYTLNSSKYPFNHFISELVARGYPSRCIEYFQQKLSWQ